MDFVKKHYEKILLSVVLLGLAVASALLPMKVSSLQEDLEKFKTAVLNPAAPKKFKPYDEVLSNNLILVKRLQNNTGLSLSLPHYLLNPVKWERKPDGKLVKTIAPSYTGASALIVSNVTPLHLEVSFLGLAGSDNSSYQISIKNEADKRSGTRTRLAELNKRNEVFTLKEVKGPKEAPTELVIELADGKRITISKDKPYRQPVGYMADLRYEPENKVFAKARKDDKLAVAKGNYKIIEINEREVVLSEEPSGKRIIIPITAPKN